MKIVSFGSLNLDHVYSVSHFVAPGETLMSEDYKVCYGGKGLNQSIAAARAGAEVIHAGVAGRGGEILSDYLRENGVDTSLLLQSPVPQGHAIIQVNGSGENCILLYPGSNHAVTREYVDKVFGELQGPGYVILQNEISQLGYIIDRAAAAGFQVVLNASPYEDCLKELDLDKLSWLLINEIEGGCFTGEQEPELIIAALREKYPRLGVVLTLGSRGCISDKEGERVVHGIFKVPVVDTTGAGDTFTGYFVAALAKGFGLAEAVRYASAAAAMAVSAPGAAQSIPEFAAVEDFLRQR